MKARFFLLIVVFVVITSASACGLGSSPSKTVKDFYTAVEDGKIEKATSYFSSRAISSMGINKLQQTIIYQTQLLGESGGVKSMKITDEQIYGDIAQVSIELELGDGSVSSDTVNLIKEDGQWKIDIGK